MKSKLRQRGFGVGGWIFIILMVGGATSVGLNLIPVYMDNRSVSSVLEGLADDQGVSAKHDAALYDLIEKRLKVNGVRDWPIKDRITIDRNRRGVTMTLDYEVRIDLIQNLDLVASFNESIELRD